MGRPIVGQQKEGVFIVQLRSKGRAFVVRKATLARLLSRTLPGLRFSDPAQTINPPPPSSVLCSS
jgi:hypothetical protein